MNKIVIYTAIFGKKDQLKEPGMLPPGCDFICFSDSDLVSNVWQIRKEIPVSTDPVRSAKIYKILPHKYFPEYTYSIWIDGNILVRSDVNQLIQNYLNTANIAFFNHANNAMDPRNSIYEEADTLLAMADKGKVKDDPELIKKQVQKYRAEGYPADNGLIVGMEIVRRHNELDVVKAMEDWWQEIQNHSRRDQLSFNYGAWKNKLKFNYMDGDSRNNQFFLWQPHRQ